MKYLLLSGVILLFLFGTYACKDSEECGPVIEDATCICPRNYDPVCGCNGVTYTNPCNAECRNITAYSEGECP